ncbi:NAD-P-binding protein [Mycena maculata]|uniref:NAD-P-binding protein n=1 Tax=Mycena maculata TaxID=230809 RepID=A0AAD7K2R5_9AGAR|nr:NAD-P-binding protein [Mycena maculata]
MKSVSEDDLADLHGKVVLVTSGNTSVGYATIQMLAQRGAKVYMGARNGERAAAAIKQLESENINDGSVLWLKLDLSDPRTARAAANEFLEKEKRLDVLVTSTVNNAAMQPVGPFKFDDKDGLLDIMVTNHFSHFVLTDTLLPPLKETANESGATPDRQRALQKLRRTLSSSAHTRPKPTTFSTKEAINKNYGESTGAYISTYGRSKLANILYMKELQKRLNTESVPITCIAVHPGRTTTEGSFLQTVTTRELTLPQTTGFSAPWRHGALTVAFAAASKEIAAQREQYQGAYLVPIAAVEFCAGREVAEGAL